jgi:hypothetical protein
MSSVEGGFNLGEVKVYTANHRGFTPEEIAERAIDKVIYVGDKSHPLIAEQARAFREQIKKVLIFYLAEAQQSERTTICAKLSLQGYEELAQLIRSL